MRLSDGELNASWPSKKEFCEKLATPSKLPEAGAALTSIDIGAVPPANSTSGLADEASIEKLSPRQMPVAESDAARLSALHSMAPARPVMIGVAVAAAAGRHDLAVGEFDRAERFAGQRGEVRACRVRGDDRTRAFERVADAPAARRHGRVAVLPERLDIEDRPHQLGRRYHDVAAQRGDRRQLELDAFGLEHRRDGSRRPSPTA